MFFDANHEDIVDVSTVETSWNCRRTYDKTKFIFMNVYDNQGRHF